MLSMITIADTLAKHVIITSLHVNLVRRYLRWGINLRSAQMSLPLPWWLENPSML